MNVKEIYILLLIGLAFINITACAKTEDRIKETIREQMIDVFQDLGEVVTIEEYEIDDIYRIRSKQDITKIVEMINANVVNVIEISSSDIVSPPPGASNHIIY